VARAECKMAKGETRWLGETVRRPKESKVVREECIAGRSGNVHLQFIKFLFLPDSLHWTSAGGLKFKVNIVKERKDQIHQASRVQLSCRDVETARIHHLFLIYNNKHKISTLSFLLIFTLI
jgi:hypothetical protein